MFPTISVNAASYDYTKYTAQLYDNYGPTLYATSTSLVTNRWQGVLDMTANSSGGAWGISSPIPLLANHTYALTVKIDGTYGGNIILSTYNRIGVGTSLANAVTSYQNNTYVNENYSKYLNDGQTIQFAFTPTIASSYIVFPFATSSSGSNWTFYITDIIVDDLGSSGVSQTEINNSLNNQTNILNESINNIQNNINDNIDSNFKDTFEDCEDAKNISFTTTDGYCFVGDGSSGTIDICTDWKVTDYISVNYKYSYTQTNFSTSNYVALYDSSKKFIGSVRQKTFTITDSRVKYVRLNSSINSNPTLTQNEFCSNKIDKTNDKLDSTNDKLDDLNSSITDGDIDSNSGKSFFDSFSSSDHGGISGIITAPLVAIKKMLDKNCSPLTATYKGKEISLPCGYEFWAKMPAIKEFINLTLGGLLCYNIIRKLYHLIENMKNPDDDRVEVMKL